MVFLPVWTRRFNPFRLDRYISRTTGFTKLRYPSYLVFRDIMKGVDGLTFISACFVERLPIFQNSVGWYDHNQLLPNIVGGVVAFTVLEKSKGYKIKALKDLAGQLKRASSAVAAGALSVGGTLFVMHADLTQVLIGPLRWGLLSGLMLTSLRLVVTPAIRNWAEEGLLARRIAIIGTNEHSYQFINKTLDHPYTCRVVAMYTDDTDDNVNNTSHALVAVRGDIQQALNDNLQEPFDNIVITLPVDAEVDFDSIYQIVKKTNASVHFAGPGLALAQNIDDVVEIGGNVVYTVVKRPLTEWQEIQKDLFDRIVGSLLLAVLTPALICVAIAIKMDSRGPVLFCQPRIGLNNRMFMTYKFRSMYAHLEDIRADVQTSRDDPRVTKIGKFLRKYSVDELAQLLNVVQGNMSLVGPRPHAPGTKAGGILFENAVKDYEVRHRVKPGITGWAQVNGCRGETPTVKDIEDRVMYDLQYISRWSMLFDIKIMFLTILREIKSKTAF